MSNKVLFAGCSYTAGNGWMDLPEEESIKVECKDSPHLWVNICHDKIPQIKDLDLVNLGKGGASNTEIFQNVVRSISTISDIDIVFCQWTAYPRYNFNVGFELWDTFESLHDTDLKKHDVNLNRGDHWPREYVNDLLDRLRVIHHPHWEILKIVDYSAILSRLAKQKGFEIFFINGLCSWDENYFIKLENVKPEEYTPFTKKEILNIDTRDDEDIFKLYDLAHEHYQDAGGVNEDQWINLYNPFNQNKIDFNFDKKHPGKQSNLLYYDIIKQKLESF